MPGTDLSFSLVFGVQAQFLSISKYSTSTSSFSTIIRRCVQRSWGWVQGILFRIPGIITNSEPDRNSKYRIYRNRATPALQLFQIRIRHIKLPIDTRSGPVISINGCVLEFSQFAYIKVLILTKIAKFLIYIQMSNNSTLIIAESDSAFSITSIS